jgi:hypothetical protein
MSKKLYRAAVLAAFAGLAIAAQASHSVALSVKETTGIRRYAYPVGVRVPFPQGALASTANTRLVLNSTEVSAQYTDEGQWPDGSIQWLSVDFNATIGPNETQTYQLEYGIDVKSGPPPRGLTVTEDSDTIQVGNVRFSKLGAPLVLSVKYRNEDLAKAGTSFGIADSSGRLLDFKSAEPAKLKILKRGPLYVVLRYTGRIAVDTGYSAPFVIAVEMPNSKSWIKVTANVDDPGKRLREISYHTPLSLGPFPWVWDFGTDRWTYGSIRNQSDSVVLTETIKAAETFDWQISSGPKGKDQIYEAARAGRLSQMIRWGHIQDGRETVAFAVDGNLHLAGKYQFALDGEGGASIRFTAAVPVTEHHLTIYEHFVTPPVQISAVTSPTSMLSPLIAICDPRQFVLSRIQVRRNSEKRH